ncbi:MAG: hypothetical protein ACRBBR_11810 [Cellvibrionaceae bacterium]
MMAIVNRLGSALWFSLLIATGCSADLPQAAPTDQIIKGPFTITAEWQTITFDEPLNTIPHIQFLELLLDKALYEPVENMKEDEFHIISSGYKKIGENQPVKVAIILVDNEGKEFRTLLGGSGFRQTELGVYNNLSYGTNADKGKFIYPKNTKFTALRIKANEKIRIEHLAWYAPYYYQSPNDTWKDVKQSEIVLFN